MNDASVWNPEIDRRPPTRQDVTKAARLLAGVIRNTPVQISKTFSGLLGAEVLLKLESVQVTGSFKVRGAYAKVSALDAEHARHGVIAASAGNHAQGVAFAAAARGIPCTIVMPKNASPAKVSATKSYNAKVIQSGGNYDEAWAAAQDVAKKEGKTII